MRLLVLILLLGILGCNERAKQFDAWQQEQVDRLQAQASQNTATAKALVESDARSRADLTSLQHDLQAGQQALAAQRDALEQQRQELEANRQRTPLLAGALKGCGAILLGIVALAICGFLLLRLNHGDDSAELADSLVLELAGQSRLFPDLTTPAIAARPSSPALDVPGAQAPDSPV